jgi:hypothetical protein
MSGREASSQTAVEREPDGWSTAGAGRDAAPVPALAPGYRCAVPPTMRACGRPCAPLGRRVVKPVAPPNQKSAQLSLGAAFFSR